MASWNLAIQTVSADADTYVVRAVVYLTTLNTVDSNNNLSVSGNWSRGGTLALNGVYNNSPVWYQDIAVSRIVGVNQTLTFNASWSGVEYWGGTLAGSNTYVVPAKIIPPNPPTVSADGVTATAAHCYCTVAGAENGATTTTINYRIHRVSDGAHMGDLQGGYSGVTFTNLARATTYDLYGQALNSAGWGGWSAAHRFTTLPVVPTMGTSYSAGTITRNSAYISGLSVDDNGGATPDNVRVEYNTTASSTGATVFTQGSWSGVTLTGLAALTTYYYRVAAHNSAGWSAYPAAWKSFVTLSDAPSDMAAPTFSLVTDTTMRVTWVAPAMNGATFVAYRYEVSLSSNFASLVQSGTSAALFIDLVGLIPGTRYYVRVRANATPNNGGYGTANQLMTGIVPQSGLRTYAIIGGVVKQGTMYAVIGGTVKQLKPMTVISGVVQTE